MQAHVIDGSVDGLHPCQFTSPPDWRHDDSPTDLLVIDQLKEELLPVFTRHHQFYVMDGKKNQMKKVLPEKIVHPDASGILEEVPVKNSTGMRSHSKTS